MSLIYDTAVPLLQTAVKPNMLQEQMPFALDWAQLPAARTARPYFRSMAGFTTWNQDGIAIRVHGPLPLLGAMAIGVGVGAAYFVMAGSRDPFDGMEIEMLEPMDMPMEEEDGATRLARLQAEQVGSYVRVFVLNKKRMPVDLNELVSEDIAASVPRDPWGASFRLHVLDEKTREFLIISAGPDGEFNTEDDIVSGE
ncbi:MAG: type II secretion system protein GspG [Planctomycetota bacterium]|nr:type II secretion system protein GspG [Planctomycetota bacterium]